jgi:hypothetical protein
MEDDLNFLEKWKTTSIFWEMEDDLHFLENGRRPNFVGGEMEDGSRL